MSESTSESKSHNVDDQNKKLPENESETKTDSPLDSESTDAASSGSQPPIDESKPEKEISVVNRLIGYLRADDESSISTFLLDLHAAEIASVLESLPPDLRRRIWKLVPSGVEGEILPILGEGVRATIIGEMQQEEVVAATEDMPVSDLALVMDTLPVDMSEAVIESLDEDRRHRLHMTLSFPEDSAGRLMSSDVVSVRANVSLAVVLRYLRRLKELPPHTDALMVTDENGLYIGKLPIADAVTGNPDDMVIDVMHEMADFVRAQTDARELALMFERRDLISVAVVDDKGDLLGRITVDDVVDIIRSEASRVMLARAGLKEEEDLFAPIFPSARRRAVWLGINLLTVFLAAWVIGRFEEALDKIVALAVLMPIVASMGGIAGSQTLTLTIRGLALGQVSSANLRWLGGKELAVGVLNGIAWAIVVALVTYGWFQDEGIALIIGAAMILNLIAAAISGVLVPVILDRMGIDPALSGAVVLTTVTDVVGFLSFLGLATVFLL